MQSRNEQPGEESIKMSPDEERAAVNSTEADSEPADEGVGALTDNQGDTPPTEN